MQLAVLGILVTTGAFAPRLTATDAAAFATLVHLCSLLPVSPTARMPGHGTRVRVLVLNVLQTSSSFADVRRLIDDVDPDVIGLVEVDQRWLDALAPSLVEYAGRIEAPRDNYSGPALYARGPATGAVDSRDGFGLQATYPTSPMWLQIPVDHVLHTCTFGVTERRVERDVGSDHLPIVVDLVVP